MKSIIKYKAFTLIEIVIALAMFSVLTMSFYFVMANLYNNSKIEFYIAKKAFAGIEDLERAATKVHDLEIESRDMLPLDKKREIEDEILNKHGDVKYIEPFEIFASQGYRSKVDAYFLSREINVGDTANNENSILTKEQELTLPRDMDRNDYYIYIVANDKKPEIEIPKYEFVKILKKKDPSNPNDQGYAVDYAYFDDVKDGRNLLGAFKIVDKTKDYLFYEKFYWEFSKRKDKEGRYFLPYNKLRDAYPITADEIIASKKGDYYKNGAEIQIDNPNEFIAVSYPFISPYYDLTKSRTPMYSAKKLRYPPYYQSLPHDGYLRFCLEPIPKSVVKLSSIKSNAIWLIALPTENTANSLLYHFDVSLAKAIDAKKLANGIEQKAFIIRDLSTSLHNEDSDSRFFEPIVAGSKISVYTDESQYGRYIKLSSSDDLIFNNPRLLGDDDNDLNYYLFLVVDTSEAIPGTIYKQLGFSGEDAFRIDYLGNNTFAMNSKHLTIDSGIAPDKSRKGLNRDLHILAIRAKYDESGMSLTYLMEVDELNSTSPATIATLKESALSSPLVLGGASGLKVKEILAFKTYFPFSGFSSPDFDDQMIEVYNYLNNKYIN